MEPTSLKYLGTHSKVEVMDLFARHVSSGKARFLRKVVVDLIANFYKEQRPELIPALVDAVNGFFSAEIREGKFEPIREKEVRDYYREDAWIWRIYLAFRKLDRSLHGLLGRDYPYVLPGKIRR